MKIKKEYIVQMPLWKGHPIIKCKDSDSNTLGKTIVRTVNKMIINMAIKNSLKVIKVKFFPVLFLN